MKHIDVIDTKINLALFKLMDEKGDFPEGADVSVSMPCDEGRITVTRHAKSPIVEGAGGFSFRLDTPPAKDGMHGFGLTVIPASWAIGIWKKQHKTILALGPLRFTVHRNLSPWRVEDKYKQDWLKARAEIAP